MTSKEATSSDRDTRDDTSDGASNPLEDAETSETEARERHSGEEEALNETNASKSDDVSVEAGNPEEYADFAAEGVSRNPVDENDVPRDDSTEHVGPFGLEQATEDNPFHFVYYLNPAGPAPSDKQLALALRIGALVQQLSRFKEDTTAEDLEKRLRQIFQAALVQTSAAEPDVFARHVAALETDFLNRVVTPAHRKRISKPTFATAAVFAGASFLGFFIYFLFGSTVDASNAATIDRLSSSADLASSLLFVVAGTLLGRMFFMVVTHQSLVTSISQFDTDGARIGKGGFVIFLDAIVGVIAFLVFYTGFLQIAIGANEVSADPSQVRSALSTLDIKSKPSVAYLFGVIVGIARTQFIDRVSSLARERLE